jgi:hypothetical protein
MSGPQVPVVPDLTLFRNLPDSTWANLLLGAESLPPYPPEQVQRDWCGNAGLPLALQSGAFYSLVKDIYARHASRPLAESRLLDFGCGWGRLIRLFAKDLPADQIFGCDPDPKILEWCRHLPGIFRVSETRPRALPFDERFDLAFAFSVFTHLGPGTHADALTALHDALAPRGVLILTIRPRTFLENRAAELSQLSDEDLRRELGRYDAGEIVYRPYNLAPVQGEVPYGETVIPLAYARRHWTDRFEIVSDTSVYDADGYQQPVVLRRK